MLLYLWHPGTHCESLTVDAVLDDSEAKDPEGPSHSPNKTHDIESQWFAFLKRFPSRLPFY